MSRHAALVGLGLLLAIVISGWGIVSSESLIVGGETVFLEIAPVDPRSLLQGDYMALDYVVAREAREAMDRTADERDLRWPARGRLLLRIDERGVGQYDGLLREGEAVPEGYLPFAYRIRGGGLEIATNAWFFEEGQAEVYEPAEYGEFRVDEDGGHILVGMRDADFQLLGELIPRWMR
jgi:uncharacterized membrane-anchored protein